MHCEDFADPLPTCGCLCLVNGHGMSVGCTTCVALLEREIERANEKAQYVLKIIVIMVDRVLQGWSCMVP